MTVLQRKLFTIYTFLDVENTFNYQQGVHMLVSVFNQPKYRGLILIAVLEVRAEHLTTLSTMIILLPSHSWSIRREHATIKSDTRSMYPQVILIKETVSEGRSQTRSLWLSHFPTAMDMWSTEYTFDVFENGGAGGWLFTEYNTY